MKAEAASLEERLADAGRNRHLFPPGSLTADADSVPRATVLRPLPTREAHAA